MDFDLEEGGDSDDSFFEEPKVLAKRGSLTKAGEKKSVESLFGLSEKSTENVTKSEPEKTKHTVTFDDSIKKVDSSSSSKLKEDWLGDPENVLEKHSRRTDLLDDILPVRPKTAKPERKVSTFDDILKDSKIGSNPKPSTPVKEVFTMSSKPSGDTGILSNISRDRRRMRRGSSTGIEDALGLFGDDYQSGDFYNKDKAEKKDLVAAKQTEEVQVKNVSEKGIPDWLGAPLSSVNKSDTSFATKTTTDTIDTRTDKKEVEDSKEPTKSISKTSTVTTINPQHINLDIQNAYSSLHAQESFLLVSLQLKKYEEALTEIREQQKDILSKQEKQMHALMEEYMMKQQMTENNVRLQQERINNQIHMLLSSSVSKSGQEDNSFKPDAHEKSSEEQHSLINSIKQRHSEEIILMEESYKKQLDLLESSAKTVEQKLKDDMNNMAEMFESKLQNVKDKVGEEIEFYRDKLKTVQEQHKDEIKLLKDHHNRVIEELKSEHSTQIEYIKQMKNHEANVFDGSEMYSKKLESNLETLTLNTHILQNLGEKVSQNYDILAKSRESTIESKEKEIMLMRKALEKSRESAENERSQMMALVRSLELKLAEQSTNASEDRWALQQASATLTARAAAIEREADYNRNVLEREREQLKTLKESLLAEQEKTMLQLTEEKLQLQKERTRFETSCKLTNTYEIERIKAEAESAIQTAKELTEKVNNERTQLQRQRNELDSLKRNLVERDREIEEKEIELEFLVQDAQTKLKEDKKVLIEAKRMESLYKERLLELQSQAALLSSREKKLAEEKVLLSRERVALYTQLKSNKNCALCKADEDSSKSEHYGLKNQETFTKVK
nr:unnamed protein product [Callosobruchus chinensis]